MLLQKHLPEPHRKTCREPVAHGSRRDSCAATPTFRVTRHLFNCVKTVTTFSPFASAGLLDENSIEDGSVAKPLDVLYAAERWSNVFLLPLQNCPHSDEKHSIWRSLPPIWLLLESILLSRGLTNFTVLILGFDLSFLRWEPLKNDRSQSKNPIVWRSVVRTNSQKPSAFAGENAPHFAK